MSSNNPKPKSQVLVTDVEAGESVEVTLYHDGPLLTVRSGERGHVVPVCLTPGQAVALALDLLNKYAGAR